MMGGTTRDVIDSSGNDGILFGPQVSQNLAALAYFVTLLSTLAVVGRFYARAFIISLLSMDDLIMLLSWICSIGVTTCWLLMLNSGLHEVCHLNHDTYVLVMKIILSSVTLSYVSLQSMKVAWGLFLLKLLPPNSQWRVPIYTLNTLAILLMIAQIAALLTHCKPLGDFWSNPRAAEDSCRANMVTYTCTVAYSAADVLLNLVYSTIPLPILWNVNCQKTKRFFLLGLMSVGYFTCACATIKLALVTQKVKGVSHWSPMFFNWTLIEIHVGITAASIPAAWPVVTLVYTKWLRPTYRRLRERRAKNDAMNRDLSIYNAPRPPPSLYQQPLQSQGSRSTMAGNPGDHPFHTKPSTSDHPPSWRMAPHNPGYDFKPPVADNAHLGPWIDSASMRQSSHSMLTVLSDYSRTSSSPYYDYSSCPSCPSRPASRTPFLTPPGSYPSAYSTNDLAIHRGWEIRVESAYVKDVG